MTNDYKFNEIVKNFDFEGELVDVTRNKSGHINDTFTVEFRDEENTNKYILQRINNSIFTDPEKLMENIEKVTKHISDKIVSEGKDPLRGTLNIIPTKDNKNVHMTEDENYFRAFKFITNAKTYDVAENIEQMYKCGKALGKFQKQLADFDANSLHETIKNFHNTKSRYENFLASVEKDASNRVESVKEEIKFVTDRAKDTSKLVDMIDRGELPLRVTHNDTKFNNVMIDITTDEPIAVIDLDTVMPGLSLYDFGDSIRSGATTALEDETDLDKVSIDIELFEAYTRGFLEETKNSLTQLEIKNLAFGAKIMTFECGMRFLNDHIDGDTYFRIHREGHNLDRARNQFKLVKDMEENMDKLNEIVLKYAK